MTQERKKSKRKMKTEETPINPETVINEPLEELLPPEMPVVEEDPGVGLRQEAAEWKDRCMRQAAEMENYKKRSEREKSDFLRRANERLVKEMLPMLDNLERALENPGDLDKNDPFYTGVAMIKSEIDKTLGNHGLDPVAAVGHAFDPNLHEAISQAVDNKVEENTVLSQMQKGYLFEGRLLRPALVVVSTRG